MENTKTTTTIENKMYNFDTIQQVQYESELWQEQYRSCIETGDYDTSDYTLKDYIEDVVDADTDQCRSIAEFIEENEEIESLNEYIQLVIENAKFYV